MDTRDRLIATIRSHQVELEAAGIRSLSLFGSVSRGEETLKSDVDLAVRLDPAARFSLFRLVGLENRLTELLGRSVQLLPEPVENPRLRASLDRDRRRVF